MFNKKLILIIFAFLIIIIPSQAVILNTFTNLLPAENITFTGNQNITRYLELPLNANITRGNITIKLFNNFNTTYTCFQEQANIATACGGLNTGRYSVINASVFATSNPVTYANDSNYATRAHHNGTSLNSGYLFVNYTIPANANKYSKVRIKEDTFSGDGRNITVNDTCWIYGRYSNGNKLSFRYRFFKGGIGYLMYGECKYGANSWTPLRSFWSGGDLYEEAMIWNITNTTYNINVSIAQYKLYNSTKYLNTTKNLNFSTILRSIVYTGCGCTGCIVSGNDCQIPYKFHSNYPVKLEYTRLNVSYNYFTNVSLIYEINGTAFNCSNPNVKSCLLYRDDNKLIYNFKSNAKTSYIVSSNNASASLRMEFQYYNTNYIVNRYIDMSLFNSSVRICGVYNYSTIYEQFLTSSSSTTWAKLRSNYANCYIAGSYLSSGYQNNYMLMGNTIERMYSLVANFKGQDYILGGMNGAVSSTTNIDSLAFEKTAYNVTYLANTLTISPSRTINNSFDVYYYLQSNANKYLRIRIQNRDNNVFVYDFDQFPNPNNVYILFSYNLLNTTNTTIFKIFVYATDKSNTVTSFVRYFNVVGRSSKMSPSFAIFISFILMLFGFFWVNSRLTFSYFGIFISLIGLVIVNFTIPTWYTVFFSAVYLVILLYTIAQMVFQNQNTVT